MKEKVSPKVVAGVMVAIVALLGFIGMKVWTASSAPPKPYVSALKPIHLEEHVNAPPGISAAGGGGGGGGEAKSGGADN